MSKVEETLEQFKLRYKKLHTCGIPMIPYDLAFSSDCPRCCPDSHQWEKEAELAYLAGKTYYMNGYWTDNPKSEAYEV